MSYQSDIADWIDAAKRNVREDVKQLTKDCQANIVLVTPIDTGRAKSCWNVVQGEVADLSVTPPLAQRLGFGILVPAKGASPLTRGQAITAGIGLQQSLANLIEPVATISNNLDYIIALEKGHSQQAGAGAMFANNVFAAVDEAERLGYNTTLTL